MHIRRMLERDKRHRKILGLIAAKPVATQGELAQLLERAGYAATQSSVSRDIAELGIVKRRGRYVAPQASEGARARGLVSLDTAGASLVVARCEPGKASAVAVEIDAAAIEEIVGTIAGEDTIFVAVEDARAQRAAMKKIWALIS
ncbi:MAG: arginine repressor [Acidobacteriota bacterium]|nr:arginine repressor [Acidobacteriota bacterium]